MSCLGLSFVHLFLHFVCAFCKLSSFFLARASFGWSFLLSGLVFARARLFTFVRLHSPFFCTVVQQGKKEPENKNCEHGRAPPFAHESEFESMSDL